jgi:carboxyl-terminal processing protease
LISNLAQEDTETQSAVQEVWSLIDKYYLDRTFHGQDWAAVREKYINTKDEMKALTEMVGTLGDKYSRILTPEQYAAIQKYDLIGVGATLMPNAQKEIMVGAPPIPGSAAATANLQVGDIVQAVNGVSTEGRTAFDIIDQIAENPNAGTIQLTIRKKDSGFNEAPTEYVLARQFQKVQNPVFYKITESRSDGTKVGYVRIAEFNALVKSSLEDALKTLKPQGANAFILDLRGNGGGAFQSAVEVSSLFLTESPTVATYVVDGTLAEIPFKSVAGRALLKEDDPLMIWMDSRTASASEVLAAALHDNCRAILAGQKSFGKGLIQAVYGLKNGAGLVLTVAKYETPNHDEIQGIGLQPDVEGMVPSTLLPGLYSSDTSQVDFGRMNEQRKLCHPPKRNPSTGNVATAATTTSL